MREYVQVWGGRRRAQWRMEDGGGRRWWRAAGAHQARRTQLGEDEGDEHDVTSASGWIESLLSGGEKHSRLQQLESE